MQNFYKLFISLSFIYFISCDSDIGELPDQIDQEVQDDNPNQEALPYNYVGLESLKNSNFYKFYNKPDAANKNSLDNNPALLDSLILAKTIVYEKNDTTYYTIPYEYYTEEAFYNLYIQETENAFIPFKLKYTKGKDYPINPHDLEVEIVPFYFSQDPDADTNLNSKSSCTPVTFYVQIKCTGSGHLPGDTTCNCGKGANCIPAKTTTINGLVCEESTLGDDTPGGGGYPGGGGTGGGGSGGGGTGNPGTNPNDPTQPGGGFDCIADYDCAGDPYQDQQLYNDCRYTSGAANCWELCEYANCLTGDDARYALSQDLNVNNRAITSLSDSQVNQVRNFIGNGNNSEKNAFAKEAVEAWANKPDMNIDFDDPLENYDFSEETTEILAFEQDYRQDMSQAELAIFDNLTRLQQLDYLHSAYLAQEYATKYFEDTIKVQYNGKGDAYRHALWNALGAAKLGASLMEQLTNAHENRPPNYAYEYKEVEMDLFNNQVGRDIGSQSIFMLMMKAKFAVNNGELKYLNNLNPSNNRATSNSNLIPTDQ